MRCAFCNTTSEELEGTGDVVAVHEASGLPVCGDAVCFEEAEACAEEAAFEHEADQYNGQMEID